ncbi:MAG: alpha/beta fold hydrolase, partial [Actinomycetota bacterium]
MTTTAPPVGFRPDPALYPFTSNWFESSVGPIHHLDEGSGRPLLLLHGNPDWSFLYRRMIPLLSGDFRCIVPDYPGFGLSPHPEGYRHRPADHAAVVGELVEHLDLRDAVLVAADWGGPIGMEVASRDPDRFSGLVLGNTMFFPALTMQRLFGAVMGTRPMQRLVLRHGIFVRPIMESLLQVDLSEEELAHYVDVAPTAEARQGQAVFVKSINGERLWLADLERR